MPETIVITITISAATSGAISYLFRKFFEHRLEKSIAEYKNDLGLKSEKVKSDLYIYTQDKVRELSKLDSYKSESLIELHTLFSEWLDSVSLLRVGPIQYDPSFQEDFSFTLDQTRKSHKIGLQFSKAMSKSEIFIPKLTYDLIKNTCVASLRVVAQYLHNLEFQPADKKNYDWFKSCRSEFESEYEKIVYPLTSQLILEFRKHFGTL
ncbi:hypothetical protein EHQ27_06280 [Leptospira wolffii]|uniref:hypothetical protein n=1 Tax=Leptospira wolffii TaxID=409998 RepID=UPI001083A8B2|nr:hypothetical protein [Leptospira wolffii]TGK71452.1 hypothetical protein EHQ35_15110 [Leptospira wolffii]TGK74917.1 hypothetical protein EHQ27_06280 [Leptospira wolffii]TGL29271.1 hypothetical protein EHQ57_10045 [Leptospira wolffii]